MNEAIENSHVISKLVFRAIKADSPTGYLRNPFSPNRRLQDGDKLPILCKDCEQLVSKWEGEFAKEVFEPFHSRDIDEFSYGPWLHKYLSSVAWRTLVLELPELVADTKNPRSVIKDLKDAESSLRLYMLGADGLGATINHHLIAWTGGDVASPALAAARPNVAIRRSAFGYSLLDRDSGFSAVITNLAGLICIHHVKCRPRDEWRGTKVHAEVGSIKQPQNVRSWIMHDFFQLIIESQHGWKKLSASQSEKILSDKSQNPNVPSMRFYARDAEIQRDELDG